jgi:hypothetical protein
LIREIFSTCPKFKVPVALFSSFGRNLMYLDMLEKFFMPVLEDKGPNDMPFHQEGVTHSHAAVGAKLLQMKVSMTEELHRHPYNLATSFR